MQAIDPAAGTVIRPSVLGFLAGRAGFTTRERGEHPPVHEGARVYGLAQVHSDRIVRLSGGEDPAEVRRIEADGLVSSSEGGIVLTVRVADCVPVLLASPEGRAVAAIHAGWRGISAGIVKRGIAMVCEASSCDPADLHAAAGPAIGPCCYEVDLETGGRIAAPAGDGVLSAVYGDGKVRADLWRAVSNQLSAAGLRQDRIDAIRVCTRCHAWLFHSFRRDGPRSGRQVGFVATL